MGKRTKNLTIETYGLCQYITICDVSVQWPPFNLISFSVILLVSVVFDKFLLRNFHIWKWGRNWKIRIFVLLRFLQWTPSDRNQISSTPIVSYVIYNKLSIWLRVDCKIQNCKISVLKIVSSKTEDRTIWFLLSFLLWTPSDRNQISSTSIVSCSIYDWLTN